MLGPECVRRCDYYRRDAVGLSSRDWRYGALRYSTVGRSYNPDSQTGFIAIKIADLMTNECVVDQRGGLVRQLELGF
jgi:hypothetical protein